WLSAATPPTPFSLHDALPIYSVFPYIRILRKVNTQPSSILAPAPSSFRLLTEAERQASLQAAMAALPQGQDIWIYGYGSLIWRRSEEHTSELQSRENLVCRLL